MSNSNKGKLTISGGDTKFNEFSGLNRRKKELIDDIRNNYHTLKTISSAEKLEKKLPYGQRHNNTYLNELKEDFSVYFDEDSGNNSTMESLTEVKQYILSEQRSLKSNLEQVNTSINDLTPYSVKDNTISSKPGGSDLDNDNKSPAKKTSRNDGGDDNNSNPPSGLGPSGTSDPSSSSSPSSSSGPLSSSDTNHMEWLDIIIIFIKTLLMTILINRIWGLFLMVVPAYQS